MLLAFYCVAMMLVQRVLCDFGRVDALSLVYGQIAKEPLSQTHTFQEGNIHVRPRDHRRKLHAGLAQSRTFARRSASLGADPKNRHFRFLPQ